MPKKTNIILFLTEPFIKLKNPIDIPINILLDKPIIAITIVTIFGSDAKKIELIISTVLETG